MENRGLDLPSEGPAGALAQAPLEAAAVAPLPSTWWAWLGPALPEQRRRVEHMAEAAWRELGDRMTTLRT